MARFTPFHCFYRLLLIRQVNTSKLSPTIWPSCSWVNLAMAPFHKSNWGILSGYEATEANLLSVPVYAWGCIMTCAIGFLGDRIGHRLYINLCVITQFFANFIKRTSLTSPSFQRALRHRWAVFICLNDWWGLHGIQDWWGILFWLPPLALLCRILLFIWQFREFFPVVPFCVAYENHL